MLLAPFRVEPRWVAEDGLDHTGLYYGTRPDDVSPSAYCIGFQESTLAYFEESGRIPASERTVTMAGNKVPVLFECSGDAPFDLVACTFFFLSGWQEMVAPERDEHGRFMVSSSIQSTYDLVAVPIVELYRALVRKEFSRRGVNFEMKTWGEALWACCATHDIDYLKKWRKGIVYREVVERAVLNSKNESMAKRGARLGNALLGLAAPSDPYSRSIKRMQQEVSMRGGKSTYFFKTAARGPRDVRYASTGKFIQEQFLNLRASDFEIGLHPSYHAFNHGRYIREEKDALFRAAGVNATSARTHYLRFDPLQTPRLLDDSGFRIDSTLGFATQEGFRRATCLPFPLYDLTEDRSLDTWEMPLVVMESTLFNRRHLDVEGALAVSRDLMDTCQKYGGVFVGLWHNLLWDEHDFPGWAQHFVSCLDYAVAGEANITSLRDALAEWK